MDTAIWVIIACGALSIVYGIWAIQSVMASDAGTKRMQEIAGAIQEGATATVRWNEIATGAVSEAEARRIAADLLAYCALDTRAMVEIWRVLEGEVGRWRIRRWG